MDIESEIPPLIDRLRSTRPELIRLAEAVSLSASVDPVLLRRMRLELVPQADVGTEADLWLSPMVESANPQGFTFRPDAARALWTVFANNQPWLETVRGLTALIHVNKPPIVQITDELIWLGLTYSVRRKRERVDELLGPVLVALLRDGRKPLARWAVRTLPRLPDAISKAENYERLAWASVSQVGGAKSAIRSISSGTLRNWLPRLLPPDSQSIDVGIRRSGRRIWIQAGSPNGDFSIEIPNIEPLTISISSTGPNDANARTLLLFIGDTRTRTVSRGRIWIRNARGDVYEIPADPSSVESGDSPYEFVGWPSDVEPTRLGATHYRHGINFAVRSANATAIDLCIYSENRETARLRLPERTNDIWHGYLSGIQNEVTYGFRVHGPYAPNDGHRFNPNKLLMDPYGKRFTGKFVWSAAQFGYEVDNPEADLSFDKRDNALDALMSQSVRSEGGSRSEGVRTPWENTILYQLHIRGTTKLHPRVPEEDRGFYSGLASDAMTSHLKRLGVTTLLVSPVHEFIDDASLLERGLANFWGENPVGYFAPPARQAHENAAIEFKEMVARLHEKGFEVVISVDYAFTAEGNELGPTLCWKGLDNTSYYRLLSDRPRYYINDTGTGNTLNVDNAIAKQMIFDSLRYWKEEMGVDGFFFRLATILGRTEVGFDQSSNIFREIAEDSVLEDAKLIVEPWDVGPGGYQVGSFPSACSELNDRYSTALRKFWIGDGTTSAVAGAMMGSPEIFNQDGRAPRASVNFVTEQHSFTLADLYSYNTKHNEKNGEDNKDGSNLLISYNCGHEGPTDDIEIRNLRRLLRKNQLACLMLSRGVPLLLAGDEVGNTQSGNNNAYCQDNEIGWIGWDNIGDPEEDLTDYVANLIRIRRRFPQLQLREWPKAPSGGMDGITWLSRQGSELIGDDWDRVEKSFLSFVLDDVQAEPLYVVINGSKASMDIVIPSANDVRRWDLLLDTTADLIATSIPAEPGRTLLVPARAVMAFAGRAIRSSPAA